MGIDSPFTGAPSIISYLMQIRHNHDDRKEKLITGQLFLLGNGFVIMERVGSRACGFPLDDCHLHMLYLYPYQEEINLSHDDVF